MNIEDLDIDWAKESYAGGSKDNSYVTVMCKNHPKAWKNGYVYKHRLIAEIAMGRFLTDEEIVHHIDENKRNNEPGNLEVTTKEEHSRDHTLARGRTVVVLTCPYCESLFVREKRTVKKNSKRTFCSRRCNGKFREH